MVLEIYVGKDKNGEPAQCHIIYLPLHLSMQTSESRSISIFSHNTQVGVGRQVLKDESNPQCFLLEKKGADTHHSSSLYD